MLEAACTKGHVIYLARKEIIICMGNKYTFEVNISLKFPKVAWSTFVM